MIETIRKLVRAAKDQDLEINECKTKYVVLNEQHKGQDVNLVVQRMAGITILKELAISIIRV